MKIDLDTAIYILLFIALIFLQDVIMSNKMAKIEAHIASVESLLKDGICDELSNGP